MKVQSKIPTEEKLFSVRLPENLTHALKVHAAQSKRSVKDLVREAIEESLTRKSVKILKVLPS